MKIICAKLISGEEIIGKVVTLPQVLTELTGKADPFSGKAYDVPAGPIILEDVRVVAAMPVGNGIQLSFMPFAFANQEGTIKIDLSKVAMAVFPPDSRLERMYIGENTGIALATESSAAAQGIILK
jgi:hypothetical protein